MYKATANLKDLGSVVLTGRFNRHPDLGRLIFQLQAASEEARQELRTIVRRVCTSFDWVIEFNDQDPTFVGCRICVPKHHRDIKKYLDGKTNDLINSIESNAKRRRGNKIVPLGGAKKPGYVNTPARR